MYVWVGYVSSLFCDELLLSLFVCVEGDVSLLFFDVVVALIVRVCGWGC